MSGPAGHVAPVAWILSGDGRTADPWHPYAETSGELAGIAREAGFDVRVVPGPLEGLAELDRLGPEAHRVRVLIVNAGDPEGPGLDGRVADEPADAELVAAATAGFDDALRHGVGILAVHSAASTLRELPAYGEALGGRWEPDRSWHPPIGPAAVRLVRGHPVAADAPHEFTLVDERYTGLVLTGGIEPVAEHEEGGARHPLVWARGLGRSRLVYSALGHDARSYASPEHRALLGRALAWVAEVPA